MNKIMIFIFMISLISISCKHVSTKEDRCKESCANINIECVSVCRGSYPAVTLNKNYYNSRHEYISDTDRCGMECDTRYNACIKRCDKPVDLNPVKNNEE